MHMKYETLDYRLGEMRYTEAKYPDDDDRVPDRPKPDVRRYEGPRYPDDDNSPNRYVIRDPRYTPYHGPKYPDD